MEGLTSLANWRRRLFCLLRSHGRGGLTYISEKENGMIHLASELLDNWGAQADIEELPTIELEPLSAEALQAVQMNLQEYDIAFVQTRRKNMSDFYRSMVPERLYPISIRWKDAQGAKRTLVLATHQKFQRRDWLETMKDLLPSDIPGRGAADSSQLS